MNVLYVLNFAGHGGTEKYVEIMMERLKFYGVKPFFAWNLDGKLSETIQQKAIPYVKLTMRSPLDLIAAFHLAAFCRKENIEVIHTNFLRENYIALLSKLFYAKPKVVYTNHVMLHNNTMLRWFNKVLTPFNHRIIAVCSLGKRNNGGK
jgi:L-malate glycosyltransferase